MALHEDDTRTLGQGPARWRNEEPEQKHGKEGVLNVIEAKQQIRSQELRYWLERLELEKKPSIYTLQPLNDCATKLYKARWAFQQQLSVDETAGLDDHNPTWGDLKRIIENVQASWKAKQEGTQRTAAERLRQVLETIHVHQTFLKILPESNTYVSIFCGSLQVLKKAALTYRKVVEGLLRVILEINDIVRLCTIDMQVFADNNLIDIAATLYCQIFEFLGKAMSWYTGSRAKRFINCFKEDAYEVFESYITEIRRLSANIKRRAQQGMHIETRTTNLMIQEIRADLREVKEQQRVLDTINGLLFLQLGEHGKLSRTDSAEPEAKDTLDAANHRQVSKMNRVRKLKEMQSSNMQNTEYIQEAITKEGLVHSARHLRRHWEGCQSLVSGDGIGPVFVEARVTIALQDWIPDRSSHFLCVSGLRQTGDLASAYQLAASICSFAIQSGAPLIHASCVAPMDEIRHNFEPESTGLMSLVYSIIARLIDNLPESFEIKEEPTIAGLDGSIENFTPALRTLGVLLNAAPSPLFCVIDNIECLDDQGSDNYWLLQFLTVLRECSESRQASITSRTFKVLFTISSHATSLIEVLEPHEIVLADQVAAVRSSGRRRLSRNPLSPATPQLIECLREGND